MKYVVQSGDSMFSISQKYNLELNTLIAANLQLSNPNEIYPGQEINIPVPSTTPIMAKPDRSLSGNKSAGT
jgi:spore coat assembly protein SafA